MVAQQGRVFLVDDVCQHLAAADTSPEEHIGVHKVQAGLIDDKALIAILNTVGEGMARDGFPLQREVPLGRVPWKPKQKKSAVSTSSCVLFPQATPHVTRSQLFSKPLSAAWKVHPNLALEGALTFASLNASCL